MPLTISAVIAAGVHLFPYRTEKLSPPAPMVLGGQPPGRVGRRRIILARSLDSGPFLFRDTIAGVELRDGDLLLRPPCEDDVPAVTEACQDEELARFIPYFPRPYREADARDWISSANEGGLARTFLITDATSDELLGAIEVRLGEVGSIGYWVTKQARGRGVATRATKLLSRWAVKEADVERLELTTHPEDVASQRVA